MIDISVIITSFNKSKYILETLESSVNQTFKNYEIIVIDDGSTDNSVDIINKFIEKSNFPNIKVIIQENKGVVEARNYAISKSNGIYIFPLDADDKITKDCLESLYNSMKQGKGDVIYSLVEYFGEKTGVKYLPKPTKLNFAKDNCCVVSALFKKDDWERYHGYDKNMKGGLEDYEFWLNFISENKVFYCVQKPLVKYRILKKSRNNEIKDMKKLKEYMLNKHKTIKMLYYFNCIIENIKKIIYTKKNNKKEQINNKIIQNSNNCKTKLNLIKENFMKGILLAGGSGTRLYPLTKIMSKQLLPVYDKPMIYYPLSTLMLFGIKDILIISTPQDTPNIEKLFGDGCKLGMNIQYAVQPEPKGIAQAFTIGADFIGNDDVCLILGDNIFYMGDQFHMFKQEIESHKGKQATIFAYHVSDPERFGVVEFDKNLKAISIEEKPKHPKSNYALVGLYFYPGDVAKKAFQLKPSARGELEITDLNKMYLEEGRMNVVPMRRGNAWLDAGTPESLMESGQFIQIIEQRQGLKIACIEEIAYRRGFIDDKQFLELMNDFKDGTEYKKYLKKVYNEKHGIE